MNLTIFIYIGLACLWIASLLTIAGINKIFKRLFSSLEDQCRLIDFLNNDIKDLKKECSRLEHNYNQLKWTIENEKTIRYTTGTVNLSNNKLQPNTMQDETVGLGIY